MTSFNDGIEAAVTTDQAYRFLECAVRNWSLVSFDRDGLEDFRIELERFRHKVLAEALKRPEPSEEEKVEKVAAVIERELMIDESLLADPATLRKIKSQRIARAALKAMEGEP